MKAEECTGCIGYEGPPCGCGCHDENRVVVVTVKLWRDEWNRDIHVTFPGKALLIVSPWDREYAMYDEMLRIQGQSNAQWN